MVARLSGFAFDFIVSELSNQGKRKIFLYGQREGAIPACILVSQRSTQISGLILEDSFIYFYEKKGIFKLKSKETRFVDIFKTLRGVSILMLHGLKGEACPFSHAQAIMNNVLNNCQDSSCEVLDESRTEEKGVN